MVSTVQRNQEGINALLKDRSQEEVRLINTKLEAMGTTVSDPWYLQLANITLLGLILEKSPDTIRQTVHEWQVDLFKLLRSEVDSLAQIKSASVEASIADAASRLIKGDIPASVQAVADGRIPVATTESDKSSLKRALSKLFSSPLVLGAIALTFLLGGVGIGAVIASPAHYVDGEGKPLSREDSLLLAWAKSNEGQFAKNLMFWNEGRLLNLDCLNDAEAYSTNLGVGNLVAVTGVCAIFVKDPSTVQVIQVEGE